MRQSDDRHRLTANSFAEIENPFQVAVATKYRHLGIGGGKLRPGHLLNAMLLRWTRLPEAEQDREAAVWLAELEMMISETDEEKARAKARLKAAHGGQSAAVKPKGRAKKAAG